ncbi:MAG: aminoacyl-tRNA hydrolase [Dehalococcoidia bacterium]|nr:aminoacyl-tRNA hydrolase [Dehalococcoidia bacterium]
MKIIVGLGNQGKAYARNRHNIGFRCLNQFARLSSIRLDRRQCRAKVGMGELQGERLLLARPATFMNLSGDSVGCLVRKHGIQLSDLLIIHDDMDLPLGKIRLRQSGGAGGHRGMNSIIAALGSQDFPRVRVGIGRPRDEETPTTEDAIISYVLSDFSPGEEAIIRPVIIKVAEAIDCFLSRGITVAMNNFN